MKINFWQILGVLLLVLGAAGVIYEKFIAKPENKNAPIIQPATQPTTLPTPA